ncbi:MAG TPA: hypothetical protein VFN61_07530 [Acidimicrobiales bacterium]|nr:hypothetical protein [Acidimicrobiales bacterium]
MNPLADLAGLRELSVQEAADYVGGDARPKAISQYGSLRDVQAITSKERGLQFVIQDGKVRLVYLGTAALPPVVSNESLTEAYGTGETLRSRQGRRAKLHVAADHGVAWSEQDGELGFVELFAPTTFDRYRDEIYKEPPSFRQ